MPNSPNAHKRSHTIRPTTTTEIRRLIIIVYYLVTASTLLSIVLTVMKRAEILATNIISGSAIIPLALRYTATVPTNITQKRGAFKKLISIIIT